MLFKYLYFVLIHTYIFSSTWRNADSSETYWTVPGELEKPWRPNDSTTNRWGVTVGPNSSVDVVIVVVVVVAVDDVVVLVFVVMVVVVVVVVYTSSFRCVGVKALLMYPTSQSIDRWHPPPPSFIPPPPPLSFLHHPSQQQAIRQQMIDKATRELEATRKASDNKEEKEVNTAVLLMYVSCPLRYSIVLGLVSFIHTCYEIRHVMMVWLIIGIFAPSMTLQLSGGTITTMTWLILQTK